MPALFQTEAAGLRLEVGELATRHLVQVDLGGRGLKTGFKGRILPANGFEVIADLADRLDVEPGIALGMAQRLDHGAKGRLAGIARQAVHRRIDRVDACLGGREDGGRGNASRVMGVEVDGQAHLVLQRLDEDLG